jgi:hypothetical protein
MTSGGLFAAGLALEERLRGRLAVKTVALIGNLREAERFAEHCPALLITLADNQPQNETGRGDAGLVEQQWTVVLLTRSSDDPSGRKGMIEAGDRAAQVLELVAGWAPTDHAPFVWVPERTRPVVANGVFYCTLTFSTYFGYAFEVAPCT